MQTIDTPAQVSVATSQPAMPQPAMTADIFERNRRLGRGVNLGNALEAPREGEWGVVLQEEYFDLIASQGFNHVRIPVRWSTHAVDTPPYTIDKEFFDRVDWAIKNALQRNLLVVLNIHHYEEIFTEPEAHFDRFLAIWGQISAHYQDYPEDLYFEILNEPHDKLQGVTWNRFMSEALAVIRQANPGRPVVIGPDGWNSGSNLGGLKLPEEDRNLIVTFHYYSPFQFTHQGAEWAEGSDQWLGTTWTGTESQQREVARDFDRVSAWAEKDQRPIYLGEFGAYSKAAMPDRALWTAFVARQAEARDMAWAYWEFCAGFGVYEPELKIWMNPILHALIP